MLSTETSWLVWNNVTAATIVNSSYSGYRLTDIEPVVIGSDMHFSATMVENTGAYATSQWYWYYGVTPAEYSAFVGTSSTTGLRPAALRPYTASDGSLRFAYIAIDNSTSPIEWWTYYGQTLSQVLQTVSNNSARLIDLRSYEVGGVTYYASIMVDNTGANNTPWWYFVDQTPTELTALLASNSARLYSLSRTPSGLYDAIMVPAGTDSWWWLINGSSLDELTFAQQHNARIFDTGQYPSGGGNYVYDAVMIGQVAPSPSSVPEPGSLALLTAGLAGGGLAMRRCRSLGPGARSRS